MIGEKKHPHLVQPAREEEIWKISEVPDFRLPIFFKL